MTFNRIKNLHTDFNTLKNALKKFESNNYCNYKFVKDEKIIKKNI